MTDLHYRPADGFFGDAIPFYTGGAYHVFFLKATRAHVERLRWSHIASRDLVHWEELPDAILPGDGDCPDSGGCWTGSVIEGGDAFHIYYTGWRPGAPTPQTICHAVSGDLVRWTKDERNPILLPDERWYGKTDWRDPFVFWDPKGQCYLMLICATTNSGPAAKRGCIGLVKSPDLERWETHPPFYAPHISGPMECPDLFGWKGRRYLIFSEFTEGMQTHYRIADSEGTSWRAPAFDTFNGQRFYAAKTAGDEGRRFAFGWIPTREGESENGKWQWGGHLAIPHELKVDVDGSLLVQCPKETTELLRFSQLTGEPPKAPLGVIGKWSLDGDRIRGERRDGLTYSILPTIRGEFALAGEISHEPNTLAFGLLIRTNADFSAGYMIRFEPARGRVVFDSFPRAGDAPTLVERPLPMAPNRPMPFTLFIEKTIVEAFIDERIALSCRAYERHDAPAGIFVIEGAARYDGLRVAHIDY